jgi:hypothetical protein
MDDASNRKLDRTVNRLIDFRDVCAVAYTNVLVFHLHAPMPFR